MLCINNINIKDKKILIRVDFNIPIVNNEIVDISKIEASIVTIKYALAQNAGVILISHLGDPVNQDQKLSLQIVLPILERLLKIPVLFSNNLFNCLPVFVENNQVVLCENIRFIEAEKQNNPEFARYLASLAEIVVMDAFASAHRKHASTYGILNYAKLAVAGLLLQKEVVNLQQALINPNRPIVAIVGGAKITTKLTILKSLLRTVDYLMVGGVIANTCLLAAGYKIGKSTCDLNFLRIAKEVCSNILLPIDVLVVNKHNAVEQKDIELIDDFDCILDLGSKTVKKYIKLISIAKTILWNGPLGKYEDVRFINGTKLLAEAVSNSNGFSIIGGGDTLAVVEQLKINKFSYISTGGGAFLEFVEQHNLPMLDLLNKFIK
ncbi:MAG: phosphoglycerate kinase [Gammaproteobacteria bacterium]|jgi:phosphoglycerate kinase